MKPCLKRFWKNKAGSAQMVGGLVGVLVIISIGLMVYWEVTASIDPADIPANAEASWNNTNSTATTVFTLAPILGIIMIASILLAYVTRFGGGAGL